MNEMFSQGGKGSTGILTNKQAVARHFGVKQSEVVYFSVGAVLSGYKVIYDKESQRAYSLPADLGSGVTAISLNVAGVLVHSAGSVDLGALAVTREEYVTLPGSFDTGVTVNTKNELVVFTDGKYHWGGALPKVVPAGSTPATTGGIGSDAWIVEVDKNLRAQISDPNGATLYPELQMARWRDEGDVRGWGAKGDGSTDDTTAIQAALATGRDLYFPTGNYVISDTLKFGIQTIRGAGCAPNPSAGTILTMTAALPIWQYDVTYGYSRGGYLGGFFLNYGETKPNNNGARKGIYLGEESQTAWPSQMTFEDITVRGAYYAFYDKTGAFQIRLVNVIGQNCWEFINKLKGTTYHLDTCYSHDCYAAFTFKDTYGVVMNNCAYDGTDDAQGLVAFTIDNCKSVVINGLQHEASFIRLDGGSDIRVLGDSLVDINGICLFGHNVLATSGEVYGIDVQGTSRVNISGYSIDTPTSAGANVFAVLTRGTARCKIQNSKLIQWVGAPLTSSLAATASSVIEYDSTVSVSAPSTGDCRDNGVVARGTLAVNTTLAPGADLNAGNITLTGDYKPAKGDALVYGATFDVQSCLIILKPLGENLCNVYIKNVSAGGSTTLLGDLKVQAIRR